MLDVDIDSRSAEVVVESLDDVVEDADVPPQAAATNMRARIIPARFRGLLTSEILFGASIRHNELLGDHGVEASTSPLRSLTGVGISQEVYPRPTV